MLIEEEEINQEVDFEDIIDLTDRGTESRSN